VGLSGATLLVRRGLGVAVLVLSLLPVYRLLDDPSAGPAGQATVRLGDATLSLVWWSLLIVGAGALGLGRLIPRADPADLLRRLDSRLAGLRPSGLALTAAVVGALLALAVGHFVFQGYPTLLDEMAQLLHARFFAVGRLAGLQPDPAASWIIQNTLVTDAGWVSQYPPFHTGLLSLGLAFGGLGLTGPMATLVMLLCTAAIARRLLPDQSSIVRWSAVLAATSPFVLALGAGYLSHVTAAALTAAGLWAGLRARDGSAGWALLAGLLAGAFAATRPWTALVLSAFFTAGIWIPRWREGTGARWLTVRMALAALGSAPGGILLAAYNTRVFGGPLRFGYAVAQGPRHGLGWHDDPWGNAYGPLEALGYTAADLLQLGVHLFETPIPATAAVGAFLLLTPRLARGATVLISWALLPVAANAFYWHHGYHLGPRMLFEAAPAWILLTVISVGGLMTMLPEGWPARSARWAIVLSVAWALALGVPGRLQNYRWSPDALARMQVPTASDTTLIFVHGGWSGRLSAELAGRGMRLDSVETAIRRNDACRVQTFLSVWSETGTREPAAVRAGLDFRPLPGNAAGLEIVEISPGSTVRVDRTAAPSPECRRQAAADRLGVVELAPLLWQGDLPGMEGGAPLFVRDLGPERNAELLARYGGRKAMILVSSSPDQPPELVPYQEGMERIWPAVTDEAGR
jgi:hypothetical protein